MARLRQEMYPRSAIRGRSEFRNAEWGIRSAICARYEGSLTYAGVLEIARPAAARDPGGYRREFLEMVQRAQQLAAPRP